jgi:sulfur carrier protein
MQITYNGQPRILADTTKTIHDFVVELGLRHQLVAVEVNGELAPRTKHSSFALSEGDQVEIVTLVGGG